MTAHPSERIPRPRFGLAGAAAMVAVCVTALALTAAGPTSPVSDEPAAKRPQPSQPCARCGQAMSDEHHPDRARPVAAAGGCPACDTAQPNQAARR